MKREKKRTPRETSANWEKGVPTSAWKNPASQKSKKGSEAQADQFKLGGVEIPQTPKPKWNSPKNHQQIYSEPCSFNQPPT